MAPFATPLAKENIPARDLEALFQLCNERYFDGEIQPSPGFTLRFTRSVKLSGCFTFALDTHVDWGIAIATRLQDHPLAVLSTMTHEMIHMLAHQRFRATGDAFYLDEAALPGHSFVNKGHGAFFLAELERLNRDYPELQIDVKSEFGDALYEQDKIQPVRLLMVTIDQMLGRGMIYRLHDKAANDWKTLRATARRMHGDAIDKVRLVEVPGHLAEGFPVLKKNNEPRANMVPVGLKGYAEKAQALLDETGTRLLPEPASVTRMPARPVVRDFEIGKARVGAVDVA
jgi:hypothetical protein